MMLVLMDCSQPLLRKTERMIDMRIFRSERKLMMELKSKSEQEVMIDILNSPHQKNNTKMMMMMMMMSSLWTSMMKNSK